LSAVELAGTRPLGILDRFVAAARTGGYLLLALPLQALGVLALPTLLFGSSLPSRLTGRERRLANVALHARIPQPPADAGTEERRIVASVPLRLAASVAAAALALLPIALTVVLTLSAAEGLAGASERYLGPWALGPAAGAVLAALAIASAIVSVAVLDGLAPPLRSVERRLLRSSSTQSVGLRETLVESIGDESLSIAYWLPEREGFVDERGLPVDLPNVDSGRTWTDVEHDGVRIAAIVHDADLDAPPDLVRAAAGGAATALESQRTQVALRARVEELRASRARIVEAGMEARRRLERDLHEGAQQHLVALSLELQMLRARVGDDPDALRILDASVEKLNAALAELRELARGIHPAILTHRGLDGAIVSLIDRTQLAVDYENELDERLSPAAETAGYFVVLEALTNVLQHAGVTEASVRVRREPGGMVVEVADDGAGGADPSLGSGLRELEDRVAALDGTLTVVSPAGGGTRVTARIPAEPTPLG
jgi:signal transduction histidine kinase